MDTIDTISQLLQASNSQYRLYDIGRKITKISKDQFEKIENNQLPYPTPSQGHACIAIAFWQKQSPQPYLWLLKLPLDERGLLNQGARNHFIAIIVEALGSDLTQDANEQQEELLKSNPYLYTPAQYKLASLNSKIKTALKQAPSEHLYAFKAYLSSSTDWESWQHIGVQGITDFVARIEEDNHNELLSEALPHLPNEVLFPLCSALENENLSVELIASIIDLLKAQLALPTSQQEQELLIQQHLLSSLASSCQHPHVVKLINELLQQQKLAPELLITLSGRCWEALANSQNLMAFFEHIIATKEQELFNSIFKDLVAVPAIRPVVFQCMRAPERSENFSQAIGQLFQKA
jgi:hypothetical protein